MRLPFIFCGLLTTLTATQGFTAPGDNVYGRFGPIFNWPIIPVHAAVLPNGKIFSWGTDGNGTQGGQFNYAVWNPDQGTQWSAHRLLPNTTGTDIFCSGNVLLTTGNVLAAGESMDWGTCSDSPLGNRGNTASR